MTRHLTGNESLPVESRCGKGRSTTFSLGVRSQESRVESRDVSLASLASDSGLRALPVRTKRCRTAGWAVQAVSFRQVFCRILLLCSALLALSVCTVFGQVEAFGLQRPSETRLFDLVAGSEFCAVVTVYSETLIGRRLSPEVIALNDLSLTRGGRHYQLKTDERLCTRDDLTIRAPTVSEEPNDQIHVFMAKDDTDFLEYMAYTLNQTYLMFAEPLKNQAQLPKEYMLESGITYYHAFKDRQGLFQLSKEKSLQMLEMTRTFCEAIRPRALPEKLSRLRALLESESATTELKASAKKAIETIEANAHK